MAGKEDGGARNGQWIRPVSGRAGHEVSEDERRYEAGDKAQLLDVISIPLERHVPEGHQRENHLLADDHYWTKEGQATWETVRALVDPYDRHFWVQGDSTYHGLNDKLSPELVAGLSSSLKLIHVPELRIQVAVEAGYGGGPGRRRVRGRFQYQGANYLLSITDPEIEEDYYRRGNGNYDVDDVCLCISVSEPYAENNNNCFRLIAAVITEGRCED